jgi:hypothetical protein
LLVRPAKQHARDLLGPYWKITAALGAAYEWHIDILPSQRSPTMSNSLLHQVIVRARQLIDDEAG